MSNSRLIGVVALVIVLALIIFGVYHFRAKAPSTGQEPQTEQSEKAPDAKPAPDSAPAPEEKADAAPAVPSFDVVRIEGNGDGVIAGRGAPGWTIKLESDGAAIAESKIDEEGAWTIILDKPLPSGKHMLGLRAVSPDGTSAVTAQQPVSVTVEGTEVAAKSDEGADKAAEAGKETPPARPTPIRFEDVQYEDAGEGGKLKLGGTGGAGDSILLYLDGQSLGQVTIGPDGAWSFEADAKLDAADHALRADLIQPGTGVVMGTTTAAFRRTQPAAATAQAEPSTGFPSVANQPQPVYPSGKAPEPSTPPEPGVVASMEPPSVANQPQPVYPNGPPPGVAAEPSTTAEADASPSVASQPQPAYPDGPPPGVTPEPTEAAKAPAEAPTAVAEAASPIPGQPKTVYPNGVPEPSSAPAPSPAPDASTAPPSVANQPQPVVPPKEVAAAEPAPTQEAVVAERPGEGSRSHTEPMVVFRGAEYKDTGSDSGKVSLSGTADPGSRILLYADNGAIGAVTVGEDGNWSLDVNKRLEPGEHTFRADRVDPTTGSVIGRASIGMARMEKPKEEEVAAQEPPAEATAPEEKTAEAEEPKPEPTKTAERQRSRVYTVRRGDTLWEIAEYYYGGGWRYRAIVRENRRKIKNPHWIYPQQKFTMPRR